METDEKQKVQLVSVVSEWSLETLRVHLTTLISALEDQTRNNRSFAADQIDAITKQFMNEIDHAKEASRSADASAAMSVSKAEMAMSEWKMGHNEFNRRIETITNASVTRESFDAFRATYESDKLATEKRFSEMIGSKNTGREMVSDRRENKNTNIAVVVAAATIAAVIGTGIGSLISFKSNGQQPAAQTIYIPAAPGTLVPNVPTAPQVPRPQ